MKKLLWHLKFLPAWLVCGLLWIIIHLPESWQLRIGKALGKIIFKFSNKIKRITYINLQICFPNLHHNQREQLAQENFISLGIAIIETARALLLPDHKLNNTYTIHGLDYLSKAQQNNK